MIDNTTNTTAPVISAPTGCMDASAFAALENLIDEHIAGNEKNYIIDLRAVDKVDARTMRTIIKINRKISEIGGSLRVVIQNPKALRYIKLTAMERVVGVYPTTEEALAGLETDDRNVPQADSQRDAGEQ
jgi:anti-anti-sigma factor